jgi:hypothetical protein
MAYTYDPIKKQCRPSNAFNTDMFLNVQNSFIYSTLTPIVDSLCHAVGNLMCVVNSVLFLPPECIQSGSRFLGSIIQWIGTGIIRQGAFVEGFVAQFVAQTPTCIGVGNDGFCSAPENAPSVPGFKLTTDGITKAVTPLFSFPLDAILADAQIGCSSICPVGSSRTGVGPGLIANPCQCYDVSHATRGQRMANVTYQGQNVLRAVSVWQAVEIFNAGGATINGTAFNAALAQFGDESFKFAYLYYPYYVQYMNNPNIGSTYTPSVPVTQYVCRAVQQPISRTSYWEKELWWNLAGAGNLWLPPCINPNDYPFRKVENSKTPQGDPRAFSTCPANGWCRPDDLPTCGYSLALGGSPDDASRYPVRAVDGILMGFIRWIACASARFEPIAMIIRMLEIFDSIVWQILAGFIDVFVAFWMFILSFILAAINAECSCYDGQDDSQKFSKVFVTPSGTYEYINPQTIQSVIIKGFIDYCYYCPLGGTKNCGCYYAPDGGDPSLSRFMKCGDHCPIYTGSPANCEIALKGITQQGTDISLMNVILPQGSEANSIKNACAGTKTVGGPAVSADEYCGGRYRGTAGFCPDPNCQWTGRNLSSIEGVQKPFYWRRCDSMFCCGCTYYTDVRREFFQCGTIGIVKAFINLLNSFFSIFTRAYWVPDGSPDWQAKRRDAPREGIREMTCRLNDKRRDPRTVSTPHSVTEIFNIMYGYDTADCFDDLVTCACRNLRMSELCSYNPSTHSVLPARSEPLHPNTIVAHVAQRFDGNSLCDNIMQYHAQAANWTNMTRLEQIAWVDCLDQRIQGERVATLLPDYVPPNYVYTRNALASIASNTARAIKKDIHAHHERIVSKRRMFAEKRKREVDPFANLGSILHERTKALALEMQSSGKMTQDSPMFRIMIQFDVWWYKYQIGYYSALKNRVVEVVRDRTWHYPTILEAQVHLEDTLSRFDANMRNLPVTHLWNTMVEVGQSVSTVSVDAWTTGTVRYMRNTLDTVYDTYVAKAHERDAQLLKEKNAKFQEVVDAMPLVQWYRNTNATGHMFTPFMEHMERVIHKARTEVQAESSLWNLDLQIGGIKKHFRELMTPRWTPYKRAKWQALGRIGFGIYDILFPHSLTKRNKERYIFGRTCLALNRAEILANSIVGYCVTELQQNLNSSNPVVRHLDALTSKRSPAGLEFSKPRDPHAWSRPVFHPTYKRRVEDHHALDQRIVKRLTKRAWNFYNASEVTALGPAGWNLYDWFIDVINGIVSSVWGINENTWLDAVRDWITNPNTSEADYPNVGARYWAYFWFRCRWPDNLNCSKGIGLLNAFWWVTLAFVILVFVGTYIIPPFMWIFAIYPVIVLWILMIGVVGVHYSPACLRLWPTSNDYDGIPLSGGRGVGFGLTIPMCLADVALNFTDTYITRCLSPLFIPTYMINGDPCPTNPNQYIDFISCAQIGVSDGLQNVLYFCYNFLGGWAIDLLNAFANVTIGLFVPDVNTYFSKTVAGFRAANPTQQDREWFCFWLTLPAIALPIAFVFIGGVFIGFVLPFLLLFIFQIWNVIESTPIVDSLPGYDGAFDEDDIGLQVPDFQNMSAQLITAENVARWIRHQNYMASTNSSGGAFSGGWRTL